MIVANIFGMLLGQHQLGITHSDTKVTLCCALLGNGIRPAVRVNVKKNTADTLRIRYNAPCDGSWEVHLAPADDVENGRRIDVLAVIVAVLKDITKLEFEVSQFLSPFHFGGLGVEFVLKWRKSTLSSVLEELAVSIERTNNDDAIPSDQFAQSLKGVVDGRKMRMIRV